MLEICTKDVLATLRLYESSRVRSNNSQRLDNDGPTVSIVVLPSKRLTLSAQELLVTFGSNQSTQKNTSNTSNKNVHKSGDSGRNGRRRKVLGLWNSADKPRDIIQPMLQLTLVGYDSSSQMGGGSDSRDGGDASGKGSSGGGGSLEHRLHVKLLPLRCYLDDFLIKFIKRLVPIASTTSNGESAPKTPPTVTPASSEEGAKSGQRMYFQCISIASTDIKIDYRASTVNLRALQSGNLFLFFFVSLTKNLIFSKRCCI